MRHKFSQLGRMFGVFLAVLTLGLGSMFVSGAAKADFDLNSPQMFFPHSGVKFTGPSGTKYRLGALKAPQGGNPNIPAWCIDLDEEAPGPDKVVQVQNLVEAKNVGQDDGLRLSTAEVAWAIDHYQMSGEANVLAALAYLVHVNLETGSDAATNIALLISDTQSAASFIDEHARNIATLARKSGVHSYESAQGQGEGQMEGTIGNIGLRAADGNWIAGRAVTVTMHGPAIFKETGTSEWAGVTQDSPITLGWKSTGNGHVRVDTAYERTVDELIALTVPGSQTTVQPPVHEDPQIHIAPGNTWRVLFDFQPTGVSQVDTRPVNLDGKISDTLTTSVDKSYGDGKWLDQTPVVYTARAYYVGRNAPATTDTVPQGAELLGEVDTRSHTVVI
ncbi:MULTISPECIES: hypothetical protein [Actinotignum]|uniref:Thioester domain-containing protein n=1 Tax=Actinotignum timonense TaxID=1870995 RepID=A0AAW9HMM5_9ACTO|nr:MULTISPECIES: hypothetical protein [Actinotignum]MDE1557968.1 hypothetical protein [Actinotignum schaalii]MDE1663291.1 hypothetical protein [Actinotignum schaalii]MDK6373180.1 hypothetical protein [Actinotignum timonense]MDK6419766.1 hypothetical protein [Actinotignum timonense]MDK6589851.1 hypothetical protein [Actinotignum timonense]